MLIPLKLKYRTHKPAGFLPKGNNSTPKKKTIWKLIEEHARKAKGPRKK